MTLETSSVVYGSTTIDYAILRTARRKTVSIAIDDGGVVLAAPRETSVERLDRVVRSRAPWITRTLRATSDIPPPPDVREFVSGETFLYAGRQHTLRVVVADEGGVSLDHGRLVVRVTSGPGARRGDEVRAHLERWYQGRASDRLPDLVAAWAEQTGVSPSRVSIASQRRRWGSCLPSGELRFNWRIVGAGKRLVEYVIAHELTHLRHADHTPAFWRALGRVMPDFEARRAQLREVGPRLVW